MTESKSSRTVETRKISRKPKELQADRSPLLALQASREDDPHLPSVQDRAQAIPTAGRFHSGEIVLLTSAQPHPAHRGQFELGQITGAALTSQQPMTPSTTDGFSLNSLC